MQSPKFFGTFWSREYVSDTDLGEDLQDGKVNTPLCFAFIDACSSVEGVGAGFAPGSLALVRISKTIDGDYNIEAACGGRSRIVTTSKCEKCHAVTYESHPFNGCTEVVVEEIMKS